MFSLLFPVENAGEMQQSCWDSLGQAAPPSEGKGLQALLMSPHVRLGSGQGVPSKQKYSQNGDSHTSCLCCPGCAQQTGWEDSSCECAYKELWASSPSILCLVPLTDSGSVCLFCCTSVVLHHFSFWRTVYIGLAAAYEQNSEDEHFIIPKISSRDAQLGEGSGTQKCTRRVIGSILITPAINLHQWQWIYKAIKMEKRRKNRGKMKK